MAEEGLHGSFRALLFTRLRRPLALKRGRAIHRNQLSCGARKRGRPSQSAAVVVSDEKGSGDSSSSSSSGGGGPEHCSFVVVPRKVRYRTFGGNCSRCARCECSPISQWHQGQNSSDPPRIVVADNPTGERHGNCTAHVPNGLRPERGDSAPRGQFFFRRTRDRASALPSHFMCDLHPMDHWPGPGTHGQNLLVRGFRVVQAGTRKQRCRNGGVGPTGTKVGWQCSKKQRKDRDERLCQLLWLSEDRQPLPPTTNSRMRRRKCGRNGWDRAPK